MSGGSLSRTAIMGGILGAGDLSGQAQSLDNLADALQVTSDATQDSLNKLTLGVSDRVGYTNVGEIMMDADRVAAMNVGGAGYLRAGGAAGLQLATGASALQTLRTAGQSALAMEAAGVSVQAANAARLYMAGTSSIAALNGAEHTQAGFAAAGDGRTGTAMKQFDLAGLNFLGAFGGMSSLSASIPRTTTSAVHFTSPAGAQGIAQSGWLNGPFSAWAFRSSQAPSNPVSAFMKTLVPPWRMGGRVEGINPAGLVAPTVRGPWSWLQNTWGVLRMPSRQSTCITQLAAVESP